MDMDMTEESFEVTCPDCYRTFDLLDRVQADEWAFGHDCPEGG